MRSFYWSSTRLWGSELECGAMQTFCRRIRAMESGELCWLVRFLVGALSVQFKFSNSAYL